LSNKANNLFSRATAWYEESIREENENAEADEGGVGSSLLGHSFIKHKEKTKNNDVQ
jgi:hypothetical protein